MEPITNQSTYLWSLPLKIRQDSFVAGDKHSLNSIYDKPSILAVFCKSLLVQMSIV